MSVLIKGMEMPERGDLHIVITSSGFVEDKHGFVLEAVAIPVPAHGRLIEDCAVKNKIANQYFDNEFARGWNAAMKQCYEAVEDAPTIIPADEMFGKSEQLAKEDEG